MHLDCTLFLLMFVKAGACFSCWDYVTVQTLDVTETGTRWSVIAKISLTMVSAGKDH